LNDKVFSRAEDFHRLSPFRAAPARSSPGGPSLIGALAGILRACQRDAEDQKQKSPNQYDDR
jgi:hypothetical protein